MSDEDRYDEEQAIRRRRSASKRHRASRRSSKESRSRTQDAAPLRIPKKGGRRP
jgi:hypothetical protein